MSEKVVYGSQSRCGKTIFMLQEYEKRKEENVLLVDKKEFKKDRKGAKSWKW